MATAVAGTPGTFTADPVLLNAIVSSVDSCMAMSNVLMRCVGISAVPARDPGNVTGLIGVHGDVSGFIAVNMAEEVARAAVGGLLQDEFPKLTSQVIDGVGEIANIIAGGIKRGLAGSQWAFSQFTVPSVIIGHQYQIAFARGLEYLAATFEHQNDDALVLEDRLMQVAISLIRL